MKTFLPKVDEISRRWLLVDCDGLILGKVAARVATILRGKHKPTFTPHLDMGDHVVLVNAEKIATTGNKLTDKMYYRHTGFKGGLKESTLKELLIRHPEQVLELAIKRMLPRTRLGRQMVRKLHVYAGPAHPHQAQKPEAVAVDTRSK